MESQLTHGGNTWQEKRSGDVSNLSLSFNASTSNVSLKKTPSKLANHSGFSSFNGLPKTPSQSIGWKTPKSAGPRKTPRKCSSAKTPKKTPCCGDRFIPNRKAMQFDLNHYLLMRGDSMKDDDSQSMLSPSQVEYQRVMSDNLNGGDLSSQRILTYSEKSPSCGVLGNMKVLYNATKEPTSNRGTIRHIPQAPERILDAPELLDDYYLNLLDWSANNLLAVCLGGSLYLWNASTGAIQQLFQMEGPEQYIGSVSWMKASNCIAVGTSNGDVQLWDVAEKKMLRNMTGHSARVGCLSWNDYILSSGSRSSSIHHHDARVAAHHVGTLSGHTQEVCGLRWSPDGRHLASGANDNLLCVWPGHSMAGASQQPIHTFTQHLSAVKALAWCPWHSNLLTSGGGTADRHIRFWNCSLGNCLSSVDTKSQVCALLWSEEYRELLSSHGFAHNQLIIWKYPTMTKVAELTGHTSRVLHVAMSPDGETVMSAAADETLRLWKCFAVDKQKKKAVAKTMVKGPTSSLRRIMR